MNRFKSAFTWLIFILLVLIFFYLKVTYNITLDEFGTSLLLLAGILIKIGLWNNPNDPNNF